MVRRIAEFLFTDDKPFLLVLEDDFSVPAPAEFFASLEAAVAQPGFWDVFLLSHTFAVPIVRTPIPDMFRVINAQTTAGYLVGRLYASRLMEVFFRSAEMLDRVAKIPQPAREMADVRYRCDILWKQLQDNDRFCARIPAPVVQRPSYSDVENKMVDYSDHP
ncbi:MAG: hypothetical protein U1E93_04195 [Alphaproteobacteria bacterium]